MYERGSYVYRMGLYVQLYQKCTEIHINNSAVEDGRHLVHGERVLISRF